MGSRWETICHMDRSSDNVCQLCFTEKCMCIFCKTPCAARALTVPPQTWCCVIQNRFSAYGPLFPAYCQLAHLCKQCDGLLSVCTYSVHGELCVQLTTVCVFTAGVEYYEQWFWSSWSAMMVASCRGRNIWLIYSLREGICYNSYQLGVKELWQYTNRVRC